MAYSANYDIEYDDDVRDDYIALERSKRRNRHDGLDCRDPDHVGCDMCEYYREEDEEC